MLECKPVVIENGKVRGNMLSIGAAVTFECEPMYAEVKSEKRSTCLSNGIWSHFPECIPGTSTLLC
jgi:hypothetical protein